MDFLPGVTPADLPPPPDVDDVAGRFTVPILTFVEQPALEEAGVGTVGHGETLSEVALSYTFWRNPADRDDPANLAELTPELSASLEHEPPWPLPAWLLDARRRLRFPAIWEAVRTTLVGDHLPERFLTAEAVLVHHVNHILMNSFRDERVRGGFPGELLGPATARAVQPGIPVPVNGRTVDGIHLDTDAHVSGLAADLGDRILSVVLPRDLLPHLTREFVDRPPRR